MTWDDAEDIALALVRKLPEQDPMRVRFTDLRRWILDLPGFDDDPERCSEGLLEAIQMAWYDEKQDELH